MLSDASRTLIFSKFSGGSVPLPPAGAPPLEPSWGLRPQTPISGGSAPLTTAGAPPQDPGCTAMHCAARSTSLKQGEFGEILDVNTWGKTFLKGKIPTPKSEGFN